VKYASEYRNRDLARRCAAAIAARVSRPWTLMEICGGQTHAILKYGIDALLPPEIALIHGPGCPVCVTPLAAIDRALALASLPEVIFCSYGDMLRVPGSGRDLFEVKASGGDVRVVYSPLDALAIARQNPDREVVFFAIGFETTAPATALAIHRAEREQRDNFSALAAHVLVPPAMSAILAAPDCAVQGFLAAGHVCTVMGYAEYEPIAARFQVPIVVTGFEPLDILQGIYACIDQLEAGRAEVDNQYARAVARPGNERAQTLLREVFAIAPQQWRGIGTIADSGLRLRDRYERFDAARKFAPALDELPSANVDAECISGEILRGRKKPGDCPAFGTRCRPESPLGAPMVSSEGACAAYYRYRHASRTPLDRAVLT